MKRPKRTDIIAGLVAVAAAAVVVSGYRSVSDLAHQRDGLAVHVDGLSKQVRDLGGTPTPGPTGPVGAAGTPGPIGARGPGPTDQQVRDAVAKYITIHPPRRGRTGRPGGLGPTGRPGATGKPGVRGQDGGPGQTGPSGQPGPQGPQGNRGPAGDQGPAGPKGDTGDRGEPGQAPSTVYCQPPADPTTGPWACTTTN